MIDYEDPFDWLPPCVDCGVRKSLAQEVRHICSDCWDEYIYCIDCLGELE